MKKIIRKNFLSFIFIIVLIFSNCFLSFSNIWYNDDIGIKYIFEDDTFKSNWKWLDSDADLLAECYYFDENGYLVHNTTIAPDGTTINALGQWIENGVVQTKQLNKITENDLTNILENKYLEFVNKCEEIKKSKKSFVEKLDTIIELKTHFRSKIPHLCAMYGYSNKYGNEVVNKFKYYTDDLITEIKYD